MRRPFVAPPLLLALIGLLAAIFYAQQKPTGALELQLLTPAEVNSGIKGGDFRLFWAQAHLAATGHAEQAYDVSAVAQQEIMRPVAQKAEVRPSFYPPHYLLLMQPLGALPYEKAWHVYNWGSVLALALVTVFAFQGEVYALFLLAGFGGLWCALAFGQNSIILTALYMAVTVWGARRERLSGLVLALASFKPHLGILAPFVLLWRAQWRTILWAVLGIAALGLLTLQAYGAQIWATYLEAARTPMQRLLDFDNVRADSMISLYAGLRHLQVPLDYALAAQAALALVALQMLWRICRRALDPQLPAAAMIMATLLAVPHAYSYDLVLLFVPLMVVVRRAQQLGWQWGDVEALLPVYALPFFVGQLNQALPVPVVPAILLLLLYRLKQHSRMDHD